MGNNSDDKNDKNKFTAAGIFKRYKTREATARGQRSGMASLLHGFANSKKLGSYSVGRNGGYGYEDIRWNIQR